jgi:arabinose-5-phosphate isomerase
MSPGTAQPDALQIARSVIAADVEAVRSVADQLDDSFLACARMVLAAEGRVVTCGSGTSGAVARRMAHLLSVCGTPAFYLHPADALHGSLGAVAPGDVLIALSKGGRSREVNDTVERARDRGAHIVAVTASAGSPLAELADVVVPVVTPDEADPGALVAMGSTVAVSAWTDALAVVLMRARGYTWEQVLYTHPSGAVGEITEVPSALGALSLDPVADSAAGA